MTKNAKEVSYSCVIFYSFTFSFFALGMLNIPYPIGDFKMIVLSVVALILSVQQLLEVKEEIEEKISELEKKSVRQADILNSIDTVEISRRKVNVGSTYPVNSRLIFAVAMVSLVTGLTLDLNFENTAIANTSTIVSFAVIFFTMGYKEQFLSRISLLNERMYEDDQKIIDYLQMRISKLESKIDSGENSEE